MQVEITKLLMEGLSQSQTNHLRHLQAAVEAQVRFKFFFDGELWEMKKFKN